MGWTAIGRASAYVRPLSPRGAVELVRSRVPASHWSEPATFGIPVGELLDDARIEQLPARPSGDDILRTRMTKAFLRWRYASSVLPYRAVVGPGGIERGVAIVRVRTRGNAREVVVATLLGVQHDGKAKRRLARTMRRAARGHADYFLGIGGIPGFVPVPSLGPIVTTRDVSQPAPAKLSDFALSMGDIELF
jgi:hypothetical protein